MASLANSVRPTTETRPAPAAQLRPMMSPTRHQRTICALPPARAWRAWPSPPAPPPLLWLRPFASSGRRARARARRGALPPRLERGSRRAPVRLPTHAGCQPRADGRAPRAARARQYRCARSAPIRGGGGLRGGGLTATRANAARLAQVLPAVHARDDHRHTDRLELGQAAQ